MLYDISIADPPILNSKMHANTIHREKHILLAVYHFYTCPMKTPAITACMHYYVNVPSKRAFETVNAK